MLFTYPNDRNGRTMTSHGNNIALWAWFVLLGVQKEHHWQNDSTNGQAVIKLFSRPANENISYWD